MPQLGTISSLRTTPSAASSYTATLPDKAPVSYDDASWNVPPQPDTEFQAYEPRQSVAPSAISNARYRNDPSVLDAGPGYLSDSISGGKHYLPEEAVSLMMGTSEVIDFQRRITRISVADSKIADVQVIDPFQLNLIAHQPGFTTLAIWDAEGQIQRTNGSSRRQRPPAGDAQHYRGRTRPHRAGESGS